LAPGGCAGSTDKEKEHYLPGIWDDVEISFTGKLRVHKALLLPSLARHSVKVKALIWNLNPAQLLFGAGMTDSLSLRVTIIEKLSGKTVAAHVQRYSSVKNRYTQVETDLPMPGAHAWSPEDPFLYAAVISIKHDNKPSDVLKKAFGMRDFERKGKFF